MATFSSSVARYPARISFFCYSGLILLGAAALTTPYCRVPGKPPITVIDALFTSTSAVCVTGLAVRSTGHDFSFAGQAVILALIQIGGIGIMTITTFITFSLGGRESLRTRTLISETIGAHVATDLRRVLRSVLLATAICEGAGFLLLASRNLIDVAVSHSTEPLGGRLFDALWSALFHSISAFCNAGFGLADDSLTRYQSDVVVNFTIILLIVFGGIGFPVLLDVRRHWGRPAGELWNSLHLHSKMMLLGTGAMIVFGTVSILALEWDNSLAELGFGGKLLASLFQSVTCRTAGFNTLPIGQLTNATLFVMVLLMIVGAGPCSTAGGFKVSTLAVLVMRAWSTFRGSAGVSGFRRSIPLTTVGRAMTTVLLYLVVLALGLTLMLAYEQSQTEHLRSEGSFLDALFELTSALGTVGLSTGITASLSRVAQLLLIVAMFIGRLGPISVAAVFTSAEHPQKIEYPQEEPLIG